MVELSEVLSNLALPGAILCAWLLGEFANRWFGLPRISSYALSGFALGPTQAGILSVEQFPTLLLLANLAFGLILFECGYRINLRWLRLNPWIALISLTEAVLTFAAVYGLCVWWGLERANAALLAALCMATSPATIVRVTNEQRASGQVTERVMHLSALNCVIAAVTFNMLVGVVVFRTSGSAWNAAYSSLVILWASVFLGAVAGVLIPALLRLTHRTRQDSTLVFIMAVLSLVVLAHSLKLSPVLAVLTCGLSARHRRLVLSSSERGFGTLGDLLSLVLFVYIAATLQWQQVWAGASLGLALVGARQAAKVLGIGLLARPSGITWRKGLLIGLATSPLSAFVILVVEQTRFAGVNLVDELAPVAAMALALEVLSPIFITRVLRWAQEVTPEVADKP